MRIFHARDHTGVDRKAVNGATPSQCLYREIKIGSSDTMMNLSKSDCISRNIIRMAKRAYGICFEQSVTVVYHIQAVCKPKK